MTYEREIFVFGSNLKGIHGSGAAKFAKDHHGAVMGVGWGLTGNSFALPTVSVPGVQLTNAQMEDAIAAFVKYAFTHQNWKFRLTKVGCGLAGWPEEFISLRFLYATPNVVLINDDGTDCCLASEWYEFQKRRKAHDESQESLDLMDRTELKS